MKRLFILSCLIVCITTIAHAQTYTQHLQEKTAGKGSVVVTQSEEIDKLVNTANVNPNQQEAANKPTQPTVKQTSIKSTRVQPTTTHRDTKPLRSTAVTLRQPLRSQKWTQARR